MNPQHPFENEQILQPEEWVGGWQSSAFVVGFTLIWSFLIYFLIGDRSPVWKYGVVPYVPGQSILSTTTPPTGAIPKQVILPIQRPEKKNAPK